jgi:hypothetical protein
MGPHANVRARIDHDSTQMLRMRKRRRTDEGCWGEVMADAILILFSVTCRLLGVLHVHESRQV